MQISVKIVDLKEIRLPNLARRQEVLDGDSGVVNEVESLVAACADRDEPLFFKTSDVGQEIFLTG
jgi:hypothetical protein